jgi:hypothetical protein
MTEDFFKAIGGGLLLLVLGFGLYSCAAWKYDECKKMGGSTPYCFMQAGARR